MKKQQKGWKRGEVFYQLTGNELDCKLANRYFSSVQQTNLKWHYHTQLICIIYENFIPGIKNTKRGSASKNLVL